MVLHEFSLTNEILLNRDLGVSVGTADGCVETQNPYRQAQS